MLVDQFLEGECLQGFGLSDRTCCWRREGMHGVDGVGGGGVDVGGRDDRLRESFIPLAVRDGGGPGWGHWSAVSVAVVKVRRAQAPWRGEGCLRRGSGGGGRHER